MAFEENLKLSWKLWKKKWKNLGAYRKNLKEKL